jgi:hypothetical protein
MTVPRWNSVPNVIGTIEAGESVKCGLPRDDGRQTLYIGRSEVLTMAQWISEDAGSEPRAYDRFKAVLEELDALPEGPLE